MKNTKQIQWTASLADVKLIAKIAARAVTTAKSLGVSYDYQAAQMDLEACHCNGCPLDLPKLLAADNGSFGHDVFGIRRFLDRNTGALGGCFLPRCAQPEKVLTS